MLFLQHVKAFLVDHILVHNNIQKKLWILFHLVTDKQMRAVFALLTALYIFFRRQF